MVAQATVSAPARPAFERKVRLDGGFERIRFEPNLYARHDQPGGLRISWDPSDGTGRLEITEEDTSSETPEAKPVEVYERLSLTEEQAAWLHSKLTTVLQLLAQWHAKNPHLI